MQHSCLCWHCHRALLFIWYAKERCGAAPRSLLKYFTPHITQSGSTSIRMSSKSEVAPLSVIYNALNSPTLLDCLHYQESNTRRNKIKNATFYSAFTPSETQVFYYVAACSHRGPCGARTKDCCASNGFNKHLKEEKHKHFFIKFRKCQRYCYWDHFWEVLFIRSQPRPSCHSVNLQPENGPPSCLGHEERELWRTVIKCALWRACSSQDQTQAEQEGFVWLKCFLLD